MLMFCYVKFWAGCPLLPAMVMFTELLFWKSENPSSFGALGPPVRKSVKSFDAADGFSPKSIRLSGCAAFG